MHYRIKNYVFATMALGLLASCAGMGMNDPIEERKSLMKANGANLKAIGAYLKSGTGSASDVAARARQVAANGERMKSLFPKGTSSKDMPGKTRAKPNIWAKSERHNQAEEMASFKLAADIMGAYANQLAAAADAGDKAAMGAAMGKLGKSGCGGCHTDFRGPKPK